MTLRIIQGPIELGAMDPEHEEYPIRDGSGFIIAGAQTYEHGEDIRRAVNNHNDLIKALEWLRAQHNPEPQNAAQANADKVLAKAKL